MTLIDTAARLLGGKAVLLSLGLGLAAWLLPLLGTVCRRPLARYHIASLACCAVGLYLPMLYLQRAVRLEDVTAWLDTQNGWSFGTTALLSVTLLVNLLCAAARGRAAE